MKDATAIAAERVERALQLRYSPFPELSMEVLTSQLNSFRVGNLRAASRTWEIMFERDGELAGPALKRYRDAARLDWEIMPADESPEAERHQEALKYFFDNLSATTVLEQDETGGVELLIRQLMTAHAYRYSIHEVILQIESASRKQITAQFRHCPVWFFESRRGKLGFLRDEFQTYGEPLLPGEWLPAIGDGLMRPCSIAYAIKHFPLRDWLLYSARFGLPAIHGETSAEKGSDEWNQFVETLQAWANDLIIVTQAGARVTLIDGTKASGALPFPDLVRASNELYSKLFRGSDLATSSKPDAVGASLQLGELNIFVQDDATWLSGTINERVVKPVIEYLFGAPPKAWFKLLAPKPDTTERDIKATEFAVKHGVAVGVQTVRDRLSLPAPEEGEEVLIPPTPSPTFPLTTPLANAEEMTFPAALAADLQPLLARVDERLQSILQIGDAALREAKWDALWREMEPMQRDILADPSAAIVLERMMADGFARGLSKKRP